MYYNLSAKCVSTVYDGLTDWLKMRYSDKAGIEPGTLLELKTAEF